MMHQPVPQRPLGIDVSGYQNLPDWEKVAAAGISFVIVKATEGNGAQNVLFEQQIRGAAAVGMCVGAYHFARPNGATIADAQVDAEDEAARFLKRLEVVADLGRVLPMLDFEATSIKNPDALVAWLLTWCRRVSQALESKVFFYTGRYFWDQSLPERATQELAELADYTLLTHAAYPGNVDPQAAKVPRPYGPWSRVSVWQYAGDDGRCPGVQGACDRLVYLDGDDSDLRALWGLAGAHFGAP
jgi:GH25 family lysozyme M1 (1,4-beta-N-acetylmuramidase)